MTKKSITRLLAAASCVAVLGGAAGALSGCTKHVHDWETKTTPATCSADGKEERVCKSDPTHTEEIKKFDKLPHTVDTWTVIKEEGLNQGKQMGTCTTCGTIATRESGEATFKSVLSESKNTLISAVANHKLTAEASVKLNDRDAYSVSATAAIDNNLLSYNANLTDHTATREEDKNQVAAGVIQFKAFGDAPGMLFEDGFDSSLFGDMDADDVSVEISKEAMKLLFGENALNTMGSLTSLDGLFFGKLGAYYAEFKQTGDVYSLDKAGFIRLLETELGKLDYTKIDELFEAAVPINDRADIITQLTGMGIMKDGKFAKDGIITAVRGALDTLITDFDVSLTVSAGKVSNVAITAKIVVPPAIFEALGLEAEESLKIDVAARIGIEYGRQEVSFNPLPALPTPSAPSWTADGKLAYAKVPNAGKIQLRILRDGKLIHGYYVDSLTNSYNIFGNTLKEAGTYSVQVRFKPKSDDTVNGYSAWSEPFTFTVAAVEAPTNVGFTDGIVTWTGADDSGIELRLINRSNKTASTYNTRDSESVFDLKNKRINLKDLGQRGPSSAGDYEIEIRSFAPAADHEKGNSEWISAGNFTKTAVPAPTDLTVGEDGFITWNGEANADIQLELGNRHDRLYSFETRRSSCMEWKDANGNPVFDLKNRRINPNGFPSYISFPAGIHELKISILAPDIRTPGGDYLLANSEWAVTTFKIETVAAPSGVNFNDGMLTWENDGDLELIVATNDEQPLPLSINTRDPSLSKWKDDDGNLVVNLENKRINIKEVGRLLTESGVYQFKIRSLAPMGDYRKIDSEWVDAGSFEKIAIPAPTEVTFSGEIITWSGGVDNADVALKLTNRADSRDNCTFDTRRSPDIKERKDDKGNPIFDLADKKINFKALMESLSFSTGEYDIEIRILTDYSDYLKGDSEWVRSDSAFIVSPVATPTHVAIGEDGFLTWEGDGDIELEFAFGDEASNPFCTRDSRVLEMRDSAGNPVFDLENKKVNLNGLTQVTPSYPGVYQVKIRLLAPLGNYTEGPSEWVSIDFTKTAVAAPTNVSLSDDGFLTWEGEDGADIELSLYNPQCGGFSLSTKNECKDWKDANGNPVFDLAGRKINLKELRKHTYYYSFSAGTCEIKIKTLSPLGDYTKADSEWAGGASFTVTAVAKPTEVSVTDGILSWEGEGDIELYLGRINKGGQLYNTRYSYVLEMRDSAGNPVFNLADKKINLNELGKRDDLSFPGMYEIRIKILSPLDDYTKTDSMLVSGGTFEKTAIAAPTAVTITEDGFLTWEGEEDADIELGLVDSEDCRQLYSTRNSNVLKLLDTKGNPVFNLADKKINLRALTLYSKPGTSYAIEIKILTSDYTKTDSEWANGGTLTVEAAPEVSGQVYSASEMGVEWREGVTSEQKDAFAAAFKAQISPEQAAKLGIDLDSITGENVLESYRLLTNAEIATNKPAFFFRADGVAFEKGVGKGGFVVEEAYGTWEQDNGCITITPYDPQIGIDEFIFDESGNLCFAFNDSLLVMQMTLTLTEEQTPPSVSGQTYNFVRNEATWSEDVTEEQKTEFVQKFKALFGDDPEEAKKKATELGIDLDTVTVENVLENAARYQNANHMFKLSIIFDADGTLRLITKNDDSDPDPLDETLGTWEQIQNSIHITPADPEQPNSSPDMFVFDQDGNLRNLEEQDGVIYHLVFALQPHTHQY